MLLEVELRPSEVLTRKERDWPTRIALDCQFCPQFRLRPNQPVLLPLTLTIWTFPAPATLVTSTKLKYFDPLIVNLIPPFFLHGILQHRQKYILYFYIIFMSEECI